MIDTATLGAAAALGSSVTWAFASTQYAKAAGRLGAPNVSLARALAVTPLFLLAALAFDGAGAFATVDAGRLAWLALSTMCSFGFADSVFFTAARDAGASRALAVASTYPVWTAIASAIWLGEALPVVRLGGIAVCVAGVAALILLRDESADMTAGARPMRGLALAGIVSLLWALNTVAVREGATGLPMAVAQALRNGMAIGVLSATIRARAGVRAGSPPLREWPVPRGAWLGLLPAIGADALLGSMLFLYGVSNAPLAVAGTLSSLAPLFAVPIALASGTERFSAGRVAAVVLTVCGIVLVTR